MNLDEINPVDKIKKGFNTFKNGFKGKSKEGFSNDELSTEENAYLSNIDKHPKFKVNNALNSTINVGYADLNGGVKVKITFENIHKEKDNEIMRKVTGLTITNPGTGSNYKAGDTIVITTDKIKDKSDPIDTTGKYIDKAKAEAEANTPPTDYVGSEDNALRFTITDTSENNWTKFISELIGLFILLILFSIIGANIVHLSNLPMSVLNTLLPSDWDSTPYKGDYFKGYDLFKKLNESETREDLLEFLFPMKSVSFPYSYDNIYKNNDLDDLGLAFYVIWPLKWLARTTAWAWSTGRLLIKYFIALLKWIMTYVKSDSVIFFLGPFILMSALSTQLTTMIGVILMYIGGFMTDVKDGWILALFGLIVFVIVVFTCCYNLFYLCGKIPCRCKKNDPSELTDSDEHPSGVVGDAAQVLQAAKPSFGGAGVTEDNTYKIVREVGKLPETILKGVSTTLPKTVWSLLTCGLDFSDSSNLINIIKCFLLFVLLIIAIISISFSSMYNTANGVFMTIQLTIFSLINLLFKNNGITLMKTEISKHVKGLTVIFILFSLAMARGNLTTNISNSYIFAGIVVIISIIFSMFKKDKE